MHRDQSRHAPQAPSDPWPSRDLLTEASEYGVCGVAARTRRSLSAQPQDCAHSMRPSCATAIVRDAAPDFANSPSIQDWTLSSDSFPQRRAR